MAVVSINLLYTTRGGTEDFQRHRVYKRVYEVVTDNPTDSEQVIGAAFVLAGFALGAPFPDDHAAVLVDVAPEQSEDSPTIWYETLTFDSSPRLKSSVDPNGTTSDPTSTYVDNPLNKPAQWSYSSVDVEEPLTEWRAVKPDGTLQFTNPPAWVGATVYALGAYVQNGGNVFRCVVAGTSGGGAGPLGNNPGADGTVTWVFWSSLADAVADPNAAILSAVMNSGNFPFDPPVMEVVSKPLIRVQKNVAAIGFDYLTSIKNAVNSIVWRGIPARCAKVLRIEAESAYEQGVAFFKATWEIGLDPETWDKRVLDCGYGAQTTITLPDGTHPLRYEEFKDSANEPYGSPVPMNGAGGKLTPGDPPVFLRGVSRQTKIVDFNALLPF